jgi:hypothetical protein
MVDCVVLIGPAGGGWTAGTADVVLALLINIAFVVLVTALEVVKNEARI